MVNVSMLVIKVKAYIDLADKCYRKLSKTFKSSTKWIRSIKKTWNSYKSMLSYKHIKID